MDMLIKLHSLPARGDSRSITHDVRKPVAPENHLVIDWVRREFSAGWASEAAAALANRPVSLFVALKDGALAGFCCYDATARGFVGPIGVAPDLRKTGIGAALLRACLDDMRTMGYAYAIAGAVGAPEFFHRVARATSIEGSEPGTYRGMLRS